MNFVKLNITSDMFASALERAKGLRDYKLNFKQELQEANGELQAKIEGSLGEIAVERWLENEAISFIDDRDNFTHDYTLQGGFKAEVKTKVRTVEPSPLYECSIPEYTINMQEADLYIFVSLTKMKNEPLSAVKYPEVFIVGIISKKKFLESARYFQEGQIDPSNNYTFKRSCYNVLIEQMTSPQDFPLKYKEHIEQQ